MPVGVGKKIPHRALECVFPGAPYVKGLLWRVPNARLQTSIQELTTQLTEMPGAEAG
jgi:hypothetical protein